MTAKSTFLDPAVQAYIVEATVREHPALRDLREETARNAHSRMAIGPEQGRFMAQLARLIGARRYLEIGVFTGYSSLAMALALPKHGYILACDVSEEWTDIARRHWKAAGIEKKIDLHIAPALETLAQLPREIEPFDMAFIDADKNNVDAYYERALELVRPGGLILVDNVIWDGAVLDPNPQDEDTRALRAISFKAGDDPRVDASLVPICDGLLIALKK
jgi:predicted O-methyltransferase YrrM